MYNNAAYERVSLKMKGCRSFGGGMEITMVDAKKIEFEFKKYMDIYKADPELGHLMQQMTFQELFNE